MSKELFESNESYEAMLDKGLRLLGEKADYFASERVRDLRSQLPPSFVPRRILDFGCGIGMGAKHLASFFPGSLVIGVDDARKALDQARHAHGSERISFFEAREFEQPASFDLCYVNGVFHHILPAQRTEAMAFLYRATAPGGYLALFENNPWNPGTRMVMARIPFDRDAVTLSGFEARRLVRRGGFTDIERMRFLFYFPRALSFLRILEPWLTALPFGGQYYVLARKSN